MRTQAISDGRELMRWNKKADDGRAELQEVSYAEGNRGEDEGIESARATSAMEELR